jgi:uncharacterized membrane-anchored protein
MMNTLLNPQGSTLTKFLNRVPAVTLVFWLIKMMSTTVGETAADYLQFNLHLGINTTMYLMSGLLLLALIVQFAVKRYIPAIYWTVVVLISIVGTLITDNLVDNYGVSLVTTTIVFSVALLIVFGLWYASEKTLAMKSINTARRELFYWAAILFTFALGTSAGDLFAESFGIGYGPSFLLFAALIAVVAVAHYAFKLNAVLAFWLAYVLTRPMGASAGDLFAQSRRNGGLGLGTTGTSVVFLVAILGMILYLSFRQSKQPLVSEPA